MKHYAIVHGFLTFPVAWLVSTSRAAVYRYVEQHHPHSTGLTWLEEKHVTTKERYADV